MKKAIFGMISLFVVTSTSSAFAWEEIIQCNDRAMVIDRELRTTNSTPRSVYYAYQIVINHSDVASYLKQGTDFVLENGKLIVGARALDGYGRFEGSTVWGGILQTKPEGAGIRVQAFRSHMGGPYPTNNWYFENCRQVRDY
jgi:hypothetical protein